MMKNFLAVFDGFKMSDSTLQYAIDLSKAENAHLTGVFLDDMIYRNYDVIKVIRESGDYEHKMAVLDEKDTIKRDQAVSQFQKACTKAGISFTVHRDKSFAIQELKEESMFADLMIIDENETFSREHEMPPTRFLRDLLGDIQCPVIVVPKYLKPIESIVLLYDGRPSSLYAIKYFNYLLKGHKSLPIEVFTVNEHSHGLHLPDNKKMREFIKRHFPGANCIVRNGDATLEILDHLERRSGNELVVLGAYKRSELSRWFKESMADLLMRNLHTPLFIAHQ